MYIYAKQTCSAGFRGGVVNLKKGIAWHRDDPFVQARPELFTDDPPVVHKTAGFQPAPVEQATQAPGEKRRGRPKLPRDESGNVIRD